MKIGRFFLQFIAIFGIMMMFAVSGLGSAYTDTTNAFSSCANANTASIKVIELNSSDGYSSHTLTGVVDENNGPIDVFVFKITQDINITYGIENTGNNTLRVDANASCSASYVDLEDGDIKSGTIQIAATAASPYYLYIYLESIDNNQDTNYNIEIRIDGSGGGVTPPVSSAYANVDVVDGYSGSGAGYNSWINTKIISKDGYALNAVYLGTDPNNPVPQAYPGDNHSASIIILYTLADMSNGDTCEDAPTVDLMTTYGGNTPVVSIIDPGETSAQSDSFKMGYIVSGTTPLVKKNIKIKYKVVDFNSLIDASGINCANKSSTGGVVEGVPACLISNSLNSQAAQNYKTVFGQIAFDSCYAANGQPCYASNGGVGASPYDHEYGCFECSIGLMPYRCSSDNFAVRPASYNTTFSPSTTLRAGEDFNVTTIAKGNLDSAITGYDGNATIAALTQVISCPVRDGNFSNSSILFNGIDTNISTDVSFGDIGVFDVNITDSTWTVVDSVKNDCIVDSASNIADANGKIGCLTRTTFAKTVIPHHFSVTPTISNHGDAFSYISANDLNTSNIAATLNIVVTAQALGNTITQNYNSTCYAKATDYNITYSPIAIDPVGSLSTLRYFETNTSANNTVAINTPINIANLSNSAFSTDTNGSANLAFRINFDRNATKVVNPFIFDVIDVNVSDVNSVTGGNIVDTNATFLFSRTHASRQRYDGTTGTANIYFETYCFGGGCDKALLPNGTASKRVDDVRWFINENHDILNDGNVSIVVQKGGTNVASDIIDASDNPIGNPSVTTLGYDGTKGYPYKTTMENNASNWLIQNENNANATTNKFQVEFDNVGNWTGEHNTSTTTTSPNKATINKRIMW